MLKGRLIIDLGTNYKSKHAKSSPRSLYQIKKYSTEIKRATEITRPPVGGLRPLIGGLGVSDRH